MSRVCCGRKDRRRCQATQDDGLSNHGEIHDGAQVDNWLEEIEIRYS